MTTFVTRRQDALGNL